MKKTYKTILMSGAAAISVVALASCGDKKDNAAVSPENSSAAAAATNPELAANTETVSLELTGLK